MPKAFKILKVVPPTLLELVRMGSLDIEIPGHPVSVNHMYGRGFGGRYFKKKNAVDWERMAAIHIRSAALSAYKTADLSSLKGMPIAIQIIVFRETWKGKTKATKDKYVRPDIDNFLKSSVDIVFKTLGLDDSAVIELRAYKIEKDAEPYIGVNLHFLNEDGDIYGN